MGAFRSERSDVMGKTRRAVPKEKVEPERPRHVKARQCDNCRIWYPPDEISRDLDEYGHPIGWLCYTCVAVAIEE